MPTVSVIIPAFNCAVYLPETIESVLAQTYTDFEILVVDDGSTDNTPEAVRPYLSRIQYIRQENRGLPAARNVGIRAAAGEFIALLDADDSWLPEKLTLQMPCFDDPHVGIVYSDFSVRYADGRFLPSYLADRPLASEGYVVDNYIRSRFLFPSCMVLRRSAMEACGLFDEEMFAAEDIELFGRICLRWKVARVPEVLMIRTEGTHNITANSNKLNDYSILAFERILEKEKSLPSATRNTIYKELGRQHWWRGYRQFKSGSRDHIRQDLMRAVRYDVTNVRQCVPVFLASLLPPSLRKRWQTAGATDKTPA